MAFTKRFAPPTLLRSVVAAGAALLLTAGVALAQVPTPVAGAAPAAAENTAMPLTTIIVIALVCAFAAAVNGLVGAIFMLILWIWLYGGVLPMIPLYLKQEPVAPWSPHLLLVLAILLLVWQYRFRGKIGPPTTARDLWSSFMERRQRASA
ncbi:MAG TPA: hypothetical protein VFN74_11395 [Chloroflexota bacterium]|jgi:hypothetical protein|nr:hypothetical protein [Chloroflexota bacterium]